MKEKNLNVEILRGILMIWIVLFHYTTRYNDLFARSFSYEFERGGVIGVTFFFIISGYFFYAGLLQSKKMSICGVGKFCINKYWRLYPAYLISLTLIFIIYQFVDLPERECSLKDFLINSIFIYHPYFSYVDSAHWFIATLIKMQVLSALFLLLNAKSRNIGILLFELFIFFLLVYSDNCHHSLIHQMTIIYTPDYFLKFLLGYNMYMIIASQDKTKYLHLCIGLFIIGYYCFTISVVFILFYGILTFLVLQNKLIPSLGNNYNPLLIIGKYSFAWYLVHQNIGFIIINQLRVWGMTNEILLFIPMLLTLCIGIFVQKIVNLLPDKIFEK